MSTACIRSPVAREPHRPRSQSGIVALRRDVSRIDRTAPAFGFPATARELAELATSHLEAGELHEAKRAAEDALLVLGAVGDPTARARISLVLGDVLLASHEAHRALERFEQAVRGFDEANELAEAARARVGLASALLLLGDPSGRAILEDAGTIYEELGDETAVLSIDAALRRAQADFEESPSSFCATAFRRTR